MTREAFLNKYEITDAMLPYYKRKFPKAAFPQGKTNYELLDNIITKRRDVKEQAKEIMIEKSGKDIKEFFNGASQACAFANNIFREDFRIMIDERILAKCKLIVEKFNKEKQ